MSFGLFTTSLFADDSVCKKIESKSIFQLPVLNELNHSDRYVFTTHNGSRFVQLDKTTEMLRWASVTDADYGSMHVKMLKAKEEIIDVIISSGEKFIAFYTKNDIHIIEIPWLYKDVSNMNYVFQRKYSGINANSMIKKVLFHPKAANDSCIVILFEDDSIWLYDFNNRDKIILNQDSGRLGIEDRATSIADMSFSNDGLTLYLLTISDGGDIYALYPCLPSRLVISGDDLKTLMSKSVLLYDSIDKNTSPEVKRSIIKQVQFVTKLDLKNKEKDTEVGLEIELAYRYVRPQGPFTIAPFPEKLYNATAREISVFGIGKQNEILAMTFDDGNILFLFKDLELSMVWDIPGLFYNNSLVLIEDMKLQSSGETKIIKSFVKDGNMLIKDKTSTFLIDTTSWSSLVSECISNEDLTPLVGVPFESKVCNLGWNDRFVSAGVWKHNGTEGLIVSSPLKIYTKNLYSKTNMFLEGKNKDEKVDEKKPMYTVKFSQPISEIIELTKNYKEECSNPFPEIIQPEVRQDLLSNSSNEEQLGVMTELSSNLISKVIKGQSLGITLHSRILEQQYELTRQLKHTQDIIKQQDQFKELNKAQISKWDDKLIKQAELIKRFTKLNEKLTQIESSDKFKDNVLSNDEMGWFNEIRNQAIKFNNFVLKQQSVRDDLSFVKKELTMIESRSQELETKTQNEWDSLRQMLKENSAILNESPKV